MTIESISEVYEIAKQNGITLAYTTNPNIRNSDMKIIKQRVFELKKQNALSDFYINNIGLLDFIKELKVERIYADYALNITNDLSIDFYIKNGIKGIVFSPELNIDKLKNISMIGNIETEMFIYAQVPSMYLAYDLLGSIEKERIASVNRNKEYCLENIHKDRLQESVHFFLFPGEPKYRLHAQSLDTSFAYILPYPLVPFGKGSKLIWLG